MGEAKGEENAEHRRRIDRPRLDFIDTGWRAVPWRFTRWAHCVTVNRES
jgi:hypothetical protein